MIIGNQIFFLLASFIIAGTTFGYDKKVTPINMDAKSIAATIWTNVNSDRR